MSQAQTAATTAAMPATSAKGRGSSKGRKRGASNKVATSIHPPYGQMVKQALKNLKEKKGASRAAILKYILQNYKFAGNVTVVNSHLRMALKRGVQSGALKQVKGSGASGSFRLADKAGSGTVKAKRPRAKKTGTAKKSDMSQSKSSKKKASSGIQKTKAPGRRKASGTTKRSSAPKKSSGPKKTIRSAKKPIKKSVKE